MKYLIILSLIVSLISCNDNSREESKEASFNLERKYNFNTGFRDFNGKIVRMEDGLFMSFMNFPTHKKIALHALDDSTHKIEIDLSGIEKRGEKVMDYEVISKDTIIVLTWYTNKVFFLNEKGEIWREKTVKNLTMEDKGRELYFELTTLFNPLMLNDSTLICGIEPYMDTDQQHKNQDAGYATSQLEMNTINAPRLLKINNIFADSLTLTFGLDDYYQRFLKNSEDRREMFQYNLINGQIICFSRYSDSLYIYDKGLRFKKSVKIKSEIVSTIGMKPLQLKEVEKNINLVSEMYLSTAIITGVHFIADKDCYLVNITHEKNEEGKSDWSSVVLDSDFNRIDEISFSTTLGLFNMSMAVNNNLIYLYKYEKDDYFINRYNVYSLSVADD